MFLNDNVLCAVFTHISILTSIVLYSVLSIYFLKEIHPKEERERNVSDCVGRQHSALFCATPANYTRNFQSVKSLISLTVDCCNLLP